MTLLVGVPSTWSAAEARDEIEPDEVPTSRMAARNFRIAPSSIITVTPFGTLNVLPSASDAP